MEFLTTAAAALNSLSPLAVIALLAFIILYQVKVIRPQQREASGVGAKVDAHMEVLRGNDLHQLPDMIEALRRIEILLTSMDAYLHARLNGGGQK